MKKILTASLVAIMAVTAANADIASTKYVDDQTGVSADGTFVFSGAAKDAATLAGAVNAIAGAVSDLAGDGTGSVSTQISTALKGATANDFSDAVKTSLGKADTAVQTSVFDTFKTDNSKAIADAKSGAETTAAGYTDTKVGEVNTALTNYKTSNDQEIADLKSADTAINTKIGNVTEGKTVVEMIADAKTAATYNDGEVRGLISGNTTAIETINNSAVMKSGIDADKVAQIETNKTGVAANLASIQAINDGQNGILAQAKADATSKANEAESAAKTYAEEKASAAQTAAETTAKGYTDTKVGEVDTALTNYKTSNDTAVQNLTTELGKVKSGETLGAGAVKLSNLDTAVQTSLAEADSAVQKSEVKTGTANGTISVQGSDVAVAGLGSAAYTESTAYDASGSAAQALADAKADAQAQVKSLKDTLTALATFPAACAEGTSDCALVIRSGTMQWEKVSY